MLYYNGDLKIANFFIWEIFLFHLTNLSNIDSSTEYI